MVFCLECGGKLVMDERHGELVCSKCGQVTAVPNATLDGVPGDHLRELPFQGETRPVLGSYVGFSRTDGKGKPLPMRSKMAVERLRTSQFMQTHRGNQRHERRQKALQALRRVAAELEAPQWAVPDAIVLHDRLYAHPYVIFPNRRLLTAGLMIIAMRHRNHSVPLREATAALGLDLGQLTWVLRRLRKYLPEASTQLSISAVAYDFAERLGHPELANAAAREAATLQLPNQNPVVAGAAAAYRALKRNGAGVGLHRLAATVGISFASLHDQLRRWREAEASA